MSFRFRRSSGRRILSDAAEARWLGENPRLAQWLSDPAFPKNQPEIYRDWLARRDKARRRRPWFLDDPGYADWTLPNHPVIGISWFEAMAFCGWLTAQGRGLGVLGEREVIRLPTELEWERAARGLEGRTWPWGGTWRDGMANAEPAGLESTTAVGLFPAPWPDDADDRGPRDLAGNVWEWTLTRWGSTIRRPAFGWPPPAAPDGRDDPGGADLRVVRGGCYLNTPRFCRGAYRGWFVSDFWEGLRGCRLVRVSLA